MGTLTIRLPDDTHSRIKALAKHRGISTNKLFEELTTIALTEFDTESRFRIRAARGSRKLGLKFLDKLDKKHKELK